ncbi:MAG: hypothetical protein V3S22_02830 [Candidatus Neomarinimicrobiota bacterium]
MKILIIFLPVFLLETALSAANPVIKFNGMFSSLEQISSRSGSMNINLRYIPVVELNFSTRFDVEISGNVFTFFDLEDSGGMADNLELKYYRNWIRFTSSRFEARLGLQNISFGPAKILRSLWWFDRLDPTDPLQLAEGVYGLRLLYDFRNNANLWFWGLYGNDKLKGWEKTATTEKKPEYGGRIQYPFGNSELAFTAHHRSVQQDGIFENRIAVDGYMDAGAGLWFESALVYTDYKGAELNYQSFLTLGTDYTFPFRNGLTATAEHLLLMEGESPFDGQLRNNISGLSLSYPLGIIDRLSFFSYYKWDSAVLFSYLSWQRTFDRWVIQISGYWTPETHTILFTGGGSGALGNQAVQLTAIFNH